MLEKHLDSAALESKWFAAWEAAGLFRSTPDQRPAFTMVIPPPNVTGMLHLGHVLNNTIQDILARYQRMRGRNVCWVPGTDHAGIATQNMVERYLRKEGIEPEALSREEFLARVWEWKEKFGGLIIRQLRRLGCSCDWSRERFTMEEDLSRAVRESFIHLYEKGWIYRGHYIVNWCPSLQTALSDDEVERSEEPSHLWHFRYPLEGGGHLVVATTRPETMLGDSGVAVHPADERYASLVGRRVVLPLVGRLIPIFADEVVERGFGSGCVKVTPAHDAADFAMGQRHSLEAIRIMDDTAHMNDNVPHAFRGMDRFTCRAAVVQAMEALGLVEKIEPHTVAVGRCYRTRDIIEPMLSEQWFIRMGEMAARALPPVLNGQIQFFPDRWVKTYEHWMNGIRDWCISRQLKWGHRIPVWFCGTCKGQTCAQAASEGDPSICRHCGSNQLTQDADVLDTWASSWLWPFSVFGWPKNTEDLAHYYPTQVLVTAPDILFFWVARMIMAGQEFMGEIPFSKVVFNGVVRDMEGRKMSKTLGNSPDPLEIIDRYGADALRFSVVYLTPYGQDTRFAADSCELGRSFGTKIWNAARFLDMSFEGVQPDSQWRSGDNDRVGRWILSRLSDVVSGMSEDLEGFRFAAAASRIYNFFWGEFCDWYVEFLKPLKEAADAAGRARMLGRTQHVLDCCLRLLHPFMPFLSEELWQHLSPRHGAFLMAQDWPAADPSFRDAQLEAEMAALQELISAVRAVRKTHAIPFKTRLTLHLRASQACDEALCEAMPLLQGLAGIECLACLEGAVPKGFTPLSVVGLEAYLDLSQLVDEEAERRKVEQKLAKLAKEILALQARLDNPGFVAGAPAAVVEKQRGELALHQRMRQELEDSLKALQGAERR